MRIRPASLALPIALIGLGPACTLLLLGCPPRPGGDEGDDPFTARYWAKSYGGAGADRATCVHATADGGLIVAGTSQRLASDTDAAVIKLDSAGNVEWSRLYGDSTLEFSGGILPVPLVEATADGGYVLVGNGRGENGPNVLVAKVNAGGGLAWRKAHDAGPWVNSELGLEDDVEPDSTDETPYMVRQTSNGGYLIAGLSKADPGVTIDGVAYPEETQVFVLALAPNGELQWRRRYGELGHEELPPAIAPAAEGGAFLCAPHDRTSDVEEVSSVWKVDFGGGVFWSQVRESDALEASAGLAHFYAVLQTDDDNDGQADDGVVFVGTKTTNIVHPVDDNDQDVWVLKLNSLGEEEWEEEINESGNLGEDIGTTVAQAFVRFGDRRAGAWLIVAGTTEDRANDSRDAWVANVDARDGGKIASLRFGPPGSIENVGAVAATDSDGDGSDDGCILAGSAFSAEHSHRGWVARVDGYDSMTLAWQTFFDLPRSGFVTSAAATNDGGFLVAGNYTPESSDQQSWLMKLTAGGAIAWQRFDGESTPKLESFATIRQTDDNGDGAADGGYIAAGYTTSFGAGGRDWWVLKLAHDGEVAWQKAIGGPQDDEPAALAQTTDGGFVVAGYSRSLGQGGMDLWIVRLTPGGEVVWEHSFGGAQDDEALTVCVLPDGTILVGGYTSSFPANGEPAQSTRAHAWLLRLDPNGQPIWQSAYPTNSGARFDVVLPLPGGGFGAAGRDGGAPSIVKLSEPGEIEWSYEFRAGDAERPSSVCATPDGGIVLGTSGTIARGESQDVDAPEDLDFIVLRCDALGQPLWTRSYGSGGTEQCGGAALTQDGGLVVAGQTDGVTDSPDFWTLRTDAEGRISDGCAGSIGAEITLSLTPTVLSRQATTAAAVSSPSAAWSVRDTAVAARPIHDIVETRQCFGNDQPDADLDGIQDGLDNCPGRSNHDQVDSDFDGLGDECDGCPQNANLDTPGPCGCERPTGDRDGDGALDCIDGCPDDPNKTSPGSCGCGNAESPDCAGCPDGDDDEDGVCNAEDRCPGARDNLDADGDGVPDCRDNCAGTANPEQADANGDGVGDVCQPQQATLVDADMSLWTVYDTHTSGNVIIDPPHQSSDGGGNADPYRRMSYGLGAAASIETVHLQAGFTLPWSPPGSNGRTLEHLDLSIDARRFTSVVSGTVVQGGFVVSQSFVIYRTAPQFVDNLSWTTHSRIGLTAADFTDDLGRHPDFSAVGGLLGFGFYRNITAASAEFESVIEGVDNFTVTAYVAP